MTTLLIIVGVLVLVLFGGPVAGYLFALAVKLGLILVFPLIVIIIWRKL